MLDSPFEGSARTMLPEVDAGAKPVVSVEVGKELLLAQQHGIPHTAITAVEGEDGALVVEQIHDLIVIRCGGMPSVDSPLPAGRTRLWKAELDHGTRSFGLSAQPKMDQWAVEETLTPSLMMQVCCCAG